MGKHMSKLENFRARKREWGLKRALHWEQMNLLAKLGIRLHYVDVGASIRQIVGEEEPEVPPSYQTRMVGLDDLLPYAGRVPDLSREFLQTAFGRGDIGSANFYADELVGFAFWSYTRARVTDQLDVLVPEGFRYSYKAWTHPNHRRANLSSMRSYVRRRTMQTPQEERVISYTETHNYPSLLHGYQRPSMRSLRMGFCGWITVFGRQIPFNSRRARWVGFEFVRRDDQRRRQYV
jgi:hypothetical protein